MESKRSDNRRRRVLFDEAVQQAGAQSNTGPIAPISKRRRSSSYGARGNHQLKTSDLIPTRWLTFGMIAAGSLLAVACVNLLQWSVSGSVSDLDEATRQAFRLTSPNSFAAWLASAAFFTTSLFSLQTFAMRRHRRDDYRGTYRIWLVFSALFLIASIQCVVPLNRVAEWLLSKAVQPPAFARGEFGVATIKLSFVVVVFIRMLIEIRSCRSASSLLVVSLAIYAFSVLLEGPWLAGRLLPQSHWITDNLQLLGALALLQCVIAYSRYVCLDVQGLIDRRARRSRKRKSRSVKNRAARNPATSATPSIPRTQHTSQAASSVSNVRPTMSPSTKPSNGPPPTSANPRDAAKSGPLKAKIDALKADANDSDDDESWDEDGDQDTNGNNNQRLSKAERRRLKKLHRQQRNAA